MIGERLDPRAASELLQRLDTDEELQHVIAKHRIVPRALAVSAGLLREIDERVDAILGGLAPAGPGALRRASLVEERRHRDRPALADLVETKAVGHVQILEDHLVE